MSQRGRGRRRRSIARNPVETPILLRENRGLSRRLDVPRPAQARRRERFPKGARHSSWRQCGRRFPVGLHGGRDYPEPVPFSCRSRAFLRHGRSHLAMPSADAKRRVGWVAVSHPPNENWWAPRSCRFSLSWRALSLLRPIPRGRKRFALHESNGIRHARDRSPGR